MENKLQEAFITMFVGMTTVFLILLLVVLSAKMLIRLLNTTGFVFNLKEKKPILPQSSNAEHTKILKQVITKWSNGKAQITSIKKI